MNAKKQLNARVSVGMRNALKAVSGISRFTLEQITEDAVRVFFKCSGKDVEARRSICIAALHQLSNSKNGLKDPFLDEPVQSHGHRAH